MRHSKLSHGVAQWHGAAIVLVAVLLAACGSSSPTATPKPAGGTPAATASPSAVTAQDRISTVFLQLLTIYQTQGLTAATQYATDQGLMTSQDEVRATLVLDTSDPDVVRGTALSVSRLGGRVTASFEDHIEFVMPIQTLLDYGKKTNRTSLFHDLAQFNHVKTVERTRLQRSSITATPGAKATPVPGGRTEGIAATAADVWQAAQITGKGVKVGIIDGSFTNYQQFLRGNLVTRSFRSDNLMGDPDADEESIHGSACAEIIQEMAPDAQIYLAAIDTHGSFYNAIDWMAYIAKVQVISISLGSYGDSPTNDTDPISRAIDRAKQAGVFFAVAAGNNGSGNIGSDTGGGHYGARFADADHDGFNDFSGTAKKNGILFQVYAERLVTIVLNWDDWADPHVNYGLYIYDDKGREVAHSDEDQTKGFDPYEWFRRKLKAGKYTLKVRKAMASDPDLPFNIFFNGPQFEQITPEGSISRPADARGAVAVAAFDVSTNIVEDFSSEGPTLDGRKKPDIAAPDSTSGFAYASVGDVNFPGTSAAAPHVAGAATLYLQAFPDATPDEVFTYFAEHAKKPKGQKQGENITGAGYLFLDAVPQGAHTGPSPTVTVTPTRAAGTPITTPSSTRPRTTATATAAPIRTATGILPRTTSTPTAAATTTGTTAFSDDYSSSSSGLPAAGYQGGEYHMSADTDRLQIAVYPKAVGEVDSETYQVTARRISGASDLFMGVVLRFADKDNYVIFAISDAGDYGLFTVTGGDLEMASDPGTTTAIRSNGTNTIQVTTNGTSFTASVNGQQVMTTDIPEAPAGGSFGLCISGSESAGGEAAFDNYQVRVG